MIMDYNRVVKDLNGLTTAQFLEDISKVYHLVSFALYARKIGPV